ncbi:MAG: hypothetical protein CL912_02800 [Deltaproteobacteria bacterium]|nr:hypothetical protein [Deltaproteobacteria bacterium]|tara:strand:- start:532 stop:837 length:306 start_codon:yes stop_codon:yes gene_type:complete
MNLNLPEYYWSTGVYRGYLLKPLSNKVINIYREEVLEYCRSAVGNCVTVISAARYRNIEMKLFYFIFSVDGLKIYKTHLFSQVKAKLSVSFCFVYSDIIIC